MRPSATAVVVLGVSTVFLTACGGSGGSGADPILRIAFPPPGVEIEAREVVVLGTGIETEAIGELLVNGIPATTTDGFKRWTATVPLAPGSNGLSVRARTSLGTELGVGLDQQLRRQGGFLLGSSSLSSMPVTPVLDAVRRRLLALIQGAPRHQLVAVNIDSGFRTVVWDQDQGTGPLPLGAGVYGTGYDPIRDVVYFGADTSAGRRILALDLATGDRRVVGSAIPLDPQSFVYDPVRDRLLVSNEAPQPLVAAIDPVTLTATELSGPHRGSGPPIPPNTSQTFPFISTSQVVLDPVEDRVVLLIAANEGSPFVVTTIDPVTGDRVDAILPTARRWAGAAWDAAGGRVLALAEDPGFNGGRSVVEVDRATATVTTIADADPPGEVATSNGFPFDPTTGKGYLRTSNGIVSLDVDDGSFALVSTWEGIAHRSLGFAWDVAGARLFVLEPPISAPRIVGYDLHTGGRILDWTGSPLGNLPALIAWDVAGRRLLVWSADTVAALDPAVGIATVLSSPSLGVGTGPSIAPTSSTGDLAVAEDGSFAYVVTPAPAAGNLYAIDLATGDRSLVAALPTPAGLFQASMAVDPRTGHLLLAEVAAHRITEVDPATGATTTLLGNGVGSGMPQDLLGAIAVDPSSGRIYFGVPQTKQVFEFDRTTGTASLVRSWGGQADFDVVGPRGTLAVANFDGFGTFQAGVSLGLGFLNLETGHYAAFRPTTN